LIGLKQLILPFLVLLSDFGGEEPYLIVLGVAQDAGYPQAACRRDCCKDAWSNPAIRRFTTCLAVVDPDSGERWLFEATPDFKDQLNLLDKAFPVSGQPGLNGIFLTHGHMGHYTGLMHLGREVMGAPGVPVYAMPRMADYLSNNGPWSQLVRLRNIVITPIADGQTVRLNKRLKVTPFLVPHRDEYTETVGYRIEGPTKTVVFIPDIDKWTRWKTPIESVVASSDLAFLDGTFFNNAEIPNRDMSQILHPFVVESMARFKKLSASERRKVTFIHFNHSNRVLDPNSEQAALVVKQGYSLATQGQKVAL